MLISVSDFISNFQYLGIALLMAIFPAEVVMPVVGFAASKGQVSLFLAITAGTLGSTLGSTVLYFFARRLSEEQVYRLSTKYGRWLGLTAPNLERAGSNFDRFAKASVFIGRFIPGVRSAVSVPAGLRRMPFGAFFLYTFAGTGIWVTFIASLGYGIAGQYERIGIIISSVSTVILSIAAILVLLAILWHEVRSRRRRRRST